MDYAVAIERISKRYSIGKRRDGHSFRESLSDTFLARRRGQPAESRSLWALKDVSFNVRPGEALAIVGQNGAGKSTLLKILSRITEPTSGRALLRGRVSSLLEVGTGFHGTLTGRENIQLNGAILGMSRKQIRERFDEIVAFAEIDRLIDTPVKYYSTGMYLRLAFAVAAHLEPEILVVDEVLAVGDASFQSKCLRKMNDVASDGRTVIFVSHNMPAVKMLCQRGVWLRRGEVAAEGTAGEIVERYLDHSRSHAALEEIQSVIDSLPEDAVFKLRRAALTQNGRQVAVVDNGTPIDVEVEFEVRKTTLGLNIQLQLCDLDETAIFESLHNGDADQPPVTEAGRYVLRATIPADFLAPRPYQLRLNAAIMNVRRCMPEPLRINFDVRQTGVVNRAYPGHQPAGRLAPRLDWTVIRREA